MKRILHSTKLMFQHLMQYSLHQHSARWSHIVCWSPVGMSTHVPNLGGTNHQTTKQAEKALTFTNKDMAPCEQRNKAVATSEDGNKHNKAHW